MLFSKILDWKKQSMLIIPICALVSLIIISDLEKIRILARELSFEIIGMIILISFIRPFLGGLRSSYAYSPINYLSVNDATKGYVLSSFGSIFLPSAIGGDIFRIEHMKNCTQSTRKEALLVAALERFVGFLCLFILVLMISFLDLPYSVSTSFIIYSMVVVIVIITLIIVVFVMNNKESIFVKAIEYLKKYSTKKLLVGIFLYSLLFQFISLSVPVIVGYSIGGKSVAANIALMTPFIALFSTLPISIGGLGLREASYVGLGTLVGIDSEISLLVGLSLSISIIISGLPGFFIQKELFSIKENLSFKERNYEEV
tara:strand:- start:8526 stop:9470 length:945 start_codon:yes stop_codon:yes gene_type:complete